MNTAFMSEDEKNCPILKYMINSVTSIPEEGGDNEVVDSEIWKDLISINKTNGIFTLESYKKAK
jgi:hypothetical protein